MGVVAGRLAQREAPADLLLIMILVLVAAAVILLAVPVITLLGSSFGGGEAGLTLAHFRAVLGHPLFFPVLSNTLLLGCGTVVVMLLCTVPLAWLFTRTDLAGRIYCSH